MVLTRGGRSGSPAYALLRLALPLTLEVSVWPAVVFDQAPLNTVPDPVPCRAVVASEHALKHDGGVLRALHDAKANARYRAGRG